MDFDWRAPEKPENARQELSQQEAQARAKAMQEAWEWVQKNLGKAQQKKQDDVNPYRREPNF